jgi:hypothetical protein
MAPDLLSTICREIDERLNELRPLLAEREQLLVAADALVAAYHEEPVPEVKETSPRGRGRRRAGAGRRGSAAGAIKRVAAGPTGVEIEGEISEGSPTPFQAEELQIAKKLRRAAPKPKENAPKPKAERAARGAAREAILGALEHGSHTVGELAVVTAMSGPNINGNLRRLAVEGVVVKAEREGKAAWALAEPTV